MTANAVSDNSEIIVSGKDMFGARLAKEHISCFSTSPSFHFLCSGQSPNNNLFKLALSRNPITVSKDSLPVSRTAWTVCKPLR